jgi:hypothetical protein
VRRESGKWRDQIRGKNYENEREKRGERKEKVKDILRK